MLSEHDRPWNQAELRALFQRKTTRTDCATCEGKGVFTIPVDDLRSDVKYRYYPCFNCPVYAQRTENEKAARYVELIRMADALQNSGWIFIKAKSGELRGHKAAIEPGRSLKHVLAQIFFEGRADLIEEVSDSSTAYGARLERYLFSKEKAKA